MRKSSRRSWDGGNVVLATLLMLALLGDVQSQSFFTDKTEAGYQLQTPPNGFVFPVRCGLTSITTEPRALQSCDTVSFHVLVNLTVAKDIVFAPFGDMRDGTVATENQLCSEPVDNAYDQRCGSETLTTAQSRPDKTGTCNPSCDELTGICACAAGTTGTCTCFKIKRFTVQPKVFARIGDAGVCFNATARAANVPQQQRCVYFNTMIPPYQLAAYGADGNPMYNMSAVVGQTVTIPVRAYDYNRIETIAISMRTDSVELPNQDWTGPTSCTSSGSTVANSGVPCNGGVWQRMLVYTPLISEEGMQYSISFNAEDNGFSQNQFSGQTLYKTATALIGAACRDQYGLCDRSGSAVSPSLTPAPGLIVNVIQQAPAFVAGRITELLYSSPGVQVSTFLSASGSPNEGQVMPKAYVNCPIQPFGVYAYKRNSAVVLTLMMNAPPMASAQDFGLVVSEQLLFRHFNGGNADSLSDLNSYYQHIRVTWTPPLGSEGRNFRLCFKAEDQFSFSIRCVVLPVVRCMYCTKADETLKLLAERFNTHWLQIWSANEADFATEIAGDFAASGVRVWNITTNPHQIEPGILLRLGPVWRTRHDYTLGYAAQRFKTTVGNLMRANPDLAHPNAQESDIVPAGSEVCIIPGICTQTDPDNPDG